MAAPRIGDTVHYTTYGPKGGPHDSPCWAATITEVNEYDPDVVGLCIVHPTDLIFQSLSRGGCRIDAKPWDSRWWSPTNPPTGGSWHRREGCNR